MNNTFYNENITKDSLARMIDHTLLRSDAKTDEIKQLCKEAATFHFASVCVNPYFVPVAKKFLEELNASVKICTVIGFPLGATSSIAKAAEAFDSVKNGADEIDMVIDIGKAVESDTSGSGLDDVRKEIEAIRKICCGHTILKVIIETCYLSETQKVNLCQIVTEAGADYIKTSTGFGTDGARLEDVRLFRKFLGKNVKIKAAGGIKTIEQAKLFLEAGCDRIGSSSLVRTLAKIHEDEV